MLALAWEILQQGAQDEVFLARYCVGWPQLAAYLRGERDGIAKTPQWVSAITGIPVGRIQLLVTPRSMMTCAYALQRAHRGEQPYWMVDCARGDAWPNRLAGRRFRLWSRLDERRG